MTLLRAITMVLITSVSSSLYGQLGMYLKGGTNTEQISDPCTDLKYPCYIHLDTSGVVIEGGNPQPLRVESWNDISGNGFDFANATKNDRPYLDTIQKINGFATVSFDSADVQNIGVTSLTGFPDSVTVAAVYHLSGASSGGSAYFGYTNNATDLMEFIQATQLGYTPSSGNPFSVSNSTQAPGDNISIFRIQGDRSNLIRYDGTLYTTITTTGPSAGVTEVNLGHTATHTVSGTYLAEYFIFDGPLPLTDCYKLYNYLSDKYQIN